MTAIFGTSIGEVMNARNTYNHNVFYVLTKDSETSKIISSALGNPEAAVDSLYMTNGYQSGYDEITFSQGFFETFDSGSTGVNFGTSAVYLDIELAKDKRVVAGKTENLSADEAIITTEIADDLLEKSTLGYITEREDLIGLVTSVRGVSGNYIRVAGIIDSSERAVYVDSFMLAKKAYEYSPMSLQLASNSGYNILEDGKVIFLTADNAASDYTVSNGEIVMLNGIPFEVAEVVTLYSSYHTWLEKTRPDLYWTDTLIKDKMKELYPDSDSESDPLYYEHWGEIVDKYYFEFRESYYSELDTWLRNYSFNQTFEAWLYCEKNVEDAKYLFVDPEYYSAVEYKKIHGEYPAQSQKIDQYDPYFRIEDYYKRYEGEYYSSGAHNYQGLLNSFLVTDSDYIKISKKIGPTHVLALSYGYTDKEKTEMSVVYNGVEHKAKNVVEYVSDYAYTVIHSYDPEKTEQWIYENLGDIESDDYYMEPIITPNSIFNTLMVGKVRSVIAGIISMGIVVLVLSVCMYFIMRSSLMLRIKEIGIYRAIGVSRKNLVFKFMIESIVLTVLTVLIGFFAMSAFVRFCLSSSVIFEAVFYYPAWLGALLLVLTCALCVGCGILPILLLVRKSPSQILAKYDI